MFTPDALARIRRSFELRPEFLTLQEVESGQVPVDDIEVLFGSWGFPALTPAQVKAFASLQHVFYAAGSIKHFGLPLLNANVQIASAKATNSRVVADFCLGQILLAAKRYFQNVLSYRNHEQGKKLKDFTHTFAGYAGTRIGLLGCGKVSRCLIGHLRQRRFSIHVVDPYLSEDEAALLGVSKSTMEEVFAHCEIISNHLPDIPALNGVIGRRHFVSMSPGGTFINTGRGAQVVEDDLVAVLEERPDLIALLDVTDPEPPCAQSRLYTMPNVILSSHIAGCVGLEVQLLVHEAIESAEKWLRGEPLDNLELLEQFDIVA
jgi:phosphoglycerate dehydrogenase-like enzyme